MSEGADDCSTTCRYQSLAANSSPSMSMSDGAGGRSSATFLMAAVSSGVPPSRNAPTTWQRVRCPQNASQ